MLYMSCSGILLNHPRLIAGLNAPAFLLPPDMRINTWGRGAAQCFAKINDSLLVVGGKAGVFVVKGQSNTVERRIRGLPRSVSRGEVTALVHDGARLFAATPSGVYVSTDTAATWRPTDIRQSIVTMVRRGGSILAFAPDSVYALAAGKWSGHGLREHTAHASSSGLVHLVFSLHSGAVLGLPGRLLIDIAGLALFVLSLSGLVLFALPRLRGPVKKTLARTAKPILRYHLKHYKQLGLLLAVPMLLLPLTGFFMRPPFVMLLAPKTRPAAKSASEASFGGVSAAAFDSVRGRILLADKNTLYRLDTSLSGMPRVISPKLPVHPMGITGIAVEQSGSILVGSFSGLIRYSPADSSVTSFADGAPVKPGPYPRHKKLWQVRSLGACGDSLVVVDFRTGPFYRDNTPVLGPMPASVGRLSPFSLWNFLFELHNGRILRSWFPNGYMLHNPIAALLCMIALVTGFLIVLRPRGARPLSKCNRREARE
jgi:hypothetical protein